MRVFSRITGPSALWHVMRDGELKGYLFGTCHIGIDAGELRDDVFDAFAESERLLFEVDSTLGLTSKFAASWRLMKSLRLPKGQKTSKLLSPVEWRRLCRILRPAKPWMIDRLHPWVLVAMVIKRETHHPKTSPMDNSILRGARQRQMRIDFFESADFQMRLLADITDSIDLDELRDAIADPAGYTRDARGVIDSYAVGDFDGMIREIHRMDDSHHILTARNEAWMPTIVGALDRRAGLPFITAGCLHFLGDGSVVELLEGEGFDCLFGSDIQ